MKKNTIVWLLILSPFFGFAQGVKANLYDKFLKKQRVETEALFFTGLPGKNKLSLAFTAIGSNLYLDVSGSGWGTTTIDDGDELNLLFSNDSVVTLKSNAIQGFEPGGLQNSYRHRYLVAVTQLDAMRKFDLVGLRKYSFQTFTDLSVPRENTAKLKRLSTLFVSELKKANLFQNLRHIRLNEIQNFIGDSVEFCSRVYKTRYFEDSEGGPTLLDVQSDFSDPFVNVVILEKDRSKFNDNPEVKYLDKEVCISGVVTLRNNIPYVVLHNRKQIKVTSPLRPDEIGLFIGDSVSVTGTVVGARYHSETEAKPTLISLAAAGSETPLTILIANNDRKNFQNPESAVWGKAIKASGLVVENGSKPQMVLHRGEQLQILAAADPAVGTKPADEQKVEVAKAAPPVAEPPAMKEETPPVVEKTAPPTETAQTTKKEAPVETTAGRSEPEALPEAEIKSNTTEAESVPAQTFASFPGGEGAFDQFIRKHIEIPEELKDSGPKEIVLSFDVDAKGIWRNMRLVTSAGKELDKALVRVLKKMPKWKPAIQNGVPVATQVVYPVMINGVEKN